MKLKNISTAAFAAVLLVLFLPVFYCIIFVGNNMNYNEEHKIITLYGNGTLLLCSILGVGILGVLCYLLKKIPYNRRTVIGFTIVSFVTCIIFYIVSVKVSKCIAFYGGWDCGMVANSARWVYEGGDMGYDDYYTIYTNNVPITWLLYKLYSLASGLSGYPYNPEFIWIQYQCAMFATAIFFSAITVLLISKKISFAALVLLINSMFLGLSPWKIIPYTDGSTIAFPVFVIFLYAIFLQLQSKWKYVLWWFMIFAGVLGGIMKATCYVALIAILIVDFAWGLFERTSVLTKLNALALRIILLLCGFVLAVCCKNGMYRTLNYQYDYDMEISWSNYLYNGLNEETTGACSGDGLAIVRAYAGYPRSVRNGFEKLYIIERIEAKGLKGLLDFWLRKQVMNYNDGTFSWYQEGFFNAWEYEDLIDSSWEAPLRDFYWEEGEDYLLFNTISQGIWIFILLGVIVEAIWTLVTSIVGMVKRKDETEVVSVEQCISTVGILTFIGMFLFVMLFEGRARYLYTCIPVFSTMAVMGFCKLTSLPQLPKRHSTGSGDI